MQIEFAPLTPGEIETALDWMGRLYTEPGGVHDRPRARRAIEWLFAHPETGGVWFIRTGAETAGYIVLTACFSLEFGGPFTLLDELYLAPHWRSQGLGSRAIQFAADWARAHGMDALRLEVAHANEGAARLYHRAGFTSQAREILTLFVG